MQNFNLLQKLFAKAVTNIVTLLLFILLCPNTSKAQNTRLNIPFNNNWKFAKITDTAQTRDHWQNVNLPHTWNAVDMQTGNNFYEGEALYEKSYVFDEKLKGKRIFIRFEGVGQVADLYVNNSLIGSHKGGYSAFAFDISYAVKYGENNLIKIKVNNKARADVIPVNHFLFGIYGGIYRPVSLIITDLVNISVTDYASSGVYITQKNVSKQKADVSIAVKVENLSGKPTSISLRNTIYNSLGKKVTQKITQHLLSPMGRQEITQDLTVNDPTLWNGLENPYLYKVSTEILKENKIIDHIDQPLGLRKIELIAGEGVFLNGKKYPMHGVARHQDRWAYGSALSNVQHAEDLAIIKEMGATTIRLAHYQQAEYMYAKADSIGFLVWAEIPFVNTFTRDEADNAKQQMEELVKQNYNHPSIYIWGLHNEVYGKTPADYPAVLTRNLNDLAQKLDPNRYTGAVSGYAEMNRPTNLNAQVQGINHYFGWYGGNIGDLKEWAQNIEKNYQGYNLILSEYGADGNIFQQQEQATLPDKWDYTSSFYPENFETKTHEKQWGIIAKHPVILASYVWNMFDFATPMWNRGSLTARNMKGLVSFDRKIKKDAFFWYKANWSKEPVIYLTERRTIERKNAITPVTVYSNQGEPSLFVNGKKINTSPVYGETAVHYIFNAVPLKKGKNKIRATVKNNGRTFSDEIEWVLK
ncbi:glycoside hydrolase family 2 TIM barrel-domain containing protein [Pedobacter sp.]|uniref:glycoside hydrolase family 2 protein n=1 Tax=Pedobacter sp. TaxID=1411316 RepID=UPI00396C6A15